MLKLESRRLGSDGLFHFISVLVRYSGRATAMAQQHSANIGSTGKKLQCIQHLPLPPRIYSEQKSSAEYLSSYPPDTICTYAPARPLPPASPDSSILTKPRLMSLQNVSASAIPYNKIQRSRFQSGLRRRRNRPRGRKRPYQDKATHHIHRP